MSFKNQVEKRRAHKTKRDRRYADPATFDALQAQCMLDNNYIHGAHANGQRSLPARPSEILGFKKSSK